MRLSVIVPARNEAEYLPVLLRALRRQSRPPDEVIVADACSTDRTARLAESAGCLVVPGGVPGAGRNAGAAAASGDVLLFLDADCDPPPDFLEHGVAEFELSGAGVASCRIVPAERSMVWSGALVLGNLVMVLTERWWPHAPGACIFALPDIHRRLGGFDESPRVAEDHDYARRARCLSTFSLLRGVRMPVSMRRAREVGSGRLVAHYLWAEANLVVGRRLPLETAAVCPSISPVPTPRPRSS